MTVYVAFLRAINTGNRRVSNDELSSCLASLGYHGVFGFLASGNVVFATERSRDGLEAEIEDVLETHLGYDVPTFVRSAEEVTSIAEHQPFAPAHLAATDGRIQVAVLKGPSTQSALDVDLPDDDQLVVDGQEMYWLPKAGISDSNLNVPAVEAALGPMTIRTQRTFARLVAKLP